MKKTILFILFFACLNLWASIPSTYYSEAEGQTGESLKSILHDIIDDHTSLSYGNLWTAFKETDKKADGTVWDMYSDVPGGSASYDYTFGDDQCGNYSGEGSCYNREHSFPKSWFNDQSPMYTDMFHLVPTDGYVNGKRSNYPFGEVDSPTWTSTNGCKLGPNTTAGYSGTVFEPIDEYKGDFARGYFYMATRYYGEDSNWPGSPMVNGAEPESWAIAMLLTWHNADPVSQKEIDRNNAIYDDWQHNRNPFIDHPEYACAIWGGACDDTYVPPVDTVSPIDPVDPVESIGDDFELTFDYDLDGCTAYQITGSTVWEYNSYNDKAYLYINSYEQPASESWIVTPTVNFDNSNSEVFSFEVSSYNANKTIIDCGVGQFEVYYSTSYTGESIDASQWTRISSIDDVMLGDKWDFVETTLDVSFIDGENVTFAFVHKSDASNGTTWEVDNVKLTSQVYTAIDEFETTGVMLYPNPADANVTFARHYNSIEICSLSGRIVTRFADVSAGECFDISSLKAGVYFVKTTADSKVSTIKLIKK